MYIFGKGIPSNDEIPQSVDTSNMQDVTRSGFYRLLINSTSWRRNNRHDGGTWDSVKLNCVAYTSQEVLVGKLSIDISLSSNKAHQLAYFLSFINQDGEFYIPSAKHHEGISKVGNAYCFDTIDELHGKSVCALIEYKGVNDKGYKQYACVGFCDENAFSASDLSKHAAHRCDKYQKFLNSIKAAASKPQQQTQGYGQQTQNYVQQTQGYGQQVNAAYYQQTSQAAQTKANDDDLPF